ncbi:hypothetical protein CO058_01585 [candidate division WWE3 bacterium CG_4_9_14_0_2_um_filter_35_11]|uniref:Uncharacterized protein n=1 Tax=candidate division WWE3 bacterium CG_4_9_14_0_2_um_filter_35_11 TaxID=1975077 RepID=A0A2M8EM15_UNCKA|nr:MAG: hypothetical protein COV25_04105 [candidate division WWE3 bacterium CG10_big_fil_rev_8_21_14_0_10_35_32]PJC23784.1 MAG: hypothetical protein CO058_01585 [candidate division WWE3 bacterium CG_4_9_14_0_2_um_filter_35_11]
MTIEPMPFTSEGVSNMEKLLFSFTTEINQMANSWYINDDELCIRYNPAGFNLESLIVDKHQGFIKRIIKSTQGTIAQVGVGIQMPCDDNRIGMLVPFFTQVNLLAISNQFSNVDKNTGVDIQKINGVFRVIKGYSHNTAKL